MRLRRTAEDGTGNVIISSDADTQLSIEGIGKAQPAGDDVSVT